MINFIQSFFLLIILLGGCKTSKDVASSVDGGQSIPVLIVQDNYKPAKDNGLFNINQVTLNKNLITIDVQYSGGCAEHEFKLYTDKNYSKSQPPKLNLTLEHNPNGDMCKAIKSEQIVFDVTNAKYPGKDKKYTVILNLEGYKSDIVYKY